MNFLGKLGATMAIFGAYAIIGGFFNQAPRILIWIYKWGDTVAWGIKIGLVGIGVILLLVGKKNAINKEKSEQE